MRFEQGPCIENKFLSEKALRGHIGYRTIRETNQERHGKWIYSKQIRGEEAITEIIQYLNLDLREIFARADGWLGEVHGGKGWFNV